MTVAPDSEAHRRIRSVPSRYRTFALIAHLREAHGITEIVPERAAIARTLFTRHEAALALPIVTRRATSRHLSPRPRRRMSGSSDAEAISRPTYDAPC
jgi:hypothetical protein